MAGPLRCFVQYIRCQRALTSPGSSSLSWSSPGMLRQAAFPARPREYDAGPTLPKVLQYAMERSRPRAPVFGLAILTAHTQPATVQQFLCLLISWIHHHWARHPHESTRSPLLDSSTPPVSFYNHALGVTSRVCVSASAPVSSFCLPSPWPISVRCSLHPHR